MDRTAVQRAMWDRLEVEKNELKAEFGGRVDRLYDKMKLEVEQVYGNVQDVIVPRSPSPLTTPNESLLNSIQHQDNVDNNIANLIITPPPANSPDRITHQTTEHNSTLTQLLTVNLIEGGQNVDEQSSSPLAVDVTSHSQPSSIHHHHDIRIQTETIPFDSSSNMSSSSDHHHQLDNSQQPNSVSLGSLTDQNGTTEMQRQQIKQELSDEATTNDRNEQSNDGDGDFVKDEYFSDCEDDSDWVVPEMKDEFEYGQEVEIKQEEDEEEDDTTDYEEMMGIKKEEEEDGETQIDDIEAQDNQGGDDDEARSLDNTQMDTTVARPIGQSRNVQNASNENESIEEGGASSESEELPNIANLSDDQTVTQSADLLSPSTSTGQRSNRTALNQQATSTASTGRNGNKRKQQTSNRNAKRSKITTEDDDGEDGEDGEDIANEDRKETKVTVLHLNCTQSYCNVKLDSMAHLNDHLRTVHQLAPLQCFATDCNARFDNPIHIREHIKVSHSQDTRFLCPVCPKENDSPHKAYNHWYNNHLTGQFKCNFVSDCAQVANTRYKMQVHQLTAHHYQSKHLNCTHPGCAASFAFKVDLKRHELTHLDRKPFHCSWLQCSHRSNRRSHLVRHIRTKHFGLPESMKEQMAKNIVDLRDPNEYVRVVVDE